MKPDKIKKLIMMIIPAAVLVALSAYLLQGDVWTFWTWYLLALVLGVAAMPLTGRLFRRFDDKGWIFSKVTAIAITGFLTWFLVTVKILKFTAVTCVAVTVICTVLSILLYRKEQKELKDRRLHNTRLLLRNYRMLKESCSKAVYSKTREEKSAAEVMEDLMSMKGSDGVIVNSIKESAERTSIIIAHVDKMLDVYRVFCSKCGEKEKRQYKVVKAMYMTKEAASVPELSKRFGVSKVTIYDLSLIHI